MRRYVGTHKIMSRIENVDTEGCLSGSLLHQT